ncbi:hypothetical protein CHLNCDRAFT_132985 [Chlorella variabilis]|uniref:DUF1990 domain-containing protein n=1 Tax=Chlorella variabilis TaxID=554065 RepID=E1Z235_CHLVA|nr:hypothetical protein CHLNCDRAFT_132985 [Chlorella variabilis]EFN59596.1 hypothetical protein CHLNCDRAFT_132985 [Chlorella variabilis]|eukprot:XP_005851698.1 hypothetical protein CHLNCDRAFT_132985 [Chlorella variabilis]
MAPLPTSLASRSGTRLTHAGCRNAAAARSRAAVLPARAAASAEAADGRDPTGLSSLRLLKPSALDMDSLMQEWSSRECNHEFAGASASAPDVPQGVKKGSFMITTNRKKVGEGKAAYDAAIAAIKSWQHLQLGWNCTTTPALKPGVTICSATQTVVPWSVLPAQVVYCKEESAEFGPGDKGMRFSVGMSSLTGHQLAGEERFQVELHADGSVWYDIYLFSRPDTLLAWASLPVVKVMQIRYVLDGLKAVAAAVKA